MSYYPALKQRLTCREVAPRYGLKVNAAGMALCPFHDERSPSLKLSRGFYCFGCGAQGDVITFVSRLFEITPGEAAQKLSVDFGILVDDHPRGPPTAQTDVNRAEVFLRPFTPVRQQTAPRYLPQGKQRVWKTAKKFPLPCEKCANKR